MQIAQITPRKRIVVDIDTRRTVMMLAVARKAHEVQEVGHEAFIRRTLKTNMGYSKLDPSPDSVKQAAKEMAAVLVKRDQEKIANARVAAECAAAQKAAELAQ